MKFTIVIPTYNREHDLANCLNSILIQTLVPNEIIVIDDGNLENGYISNWQSICFKGGISFVYYKKNHEIEPRGSSESRNKALELISNEIFFILDDDVVLENNFCKDVMLVWQNSDNEKLIGVGGIIKNRRKRYRFEKIYNIVFGLSSKYDWDVNKACFQVWNEEIESLSKGYYTHGGACSYCLNKTRELNFTTFSGGRTALEDVDFCLRAKHKGYHFLIQPQAQLYHYPSKVSRESMYLMGYKEGYNRKMIFKSQYKNPSLYIRTWFLWANIGWILRQFLIGNFRKGVGTVRGCWG